MKYIQWSDIEFLEVILELEELQGKSIIIIPELFPNSIKRKELK